MSNSNEQTVTLPGGTIRVQAGGPVDTTPPPSETLRSGVSSGSTLRISGGNVEEFGGTSRYVINDDARGTEASLLDTARSPGGSRSGVPNDGWSIIVNGTTLSIGAAINLGILRRTPGGGYQATGKGLE